MGKLRQSRIVRHASHIDVRVQDRDVEILEALGKMRFLTTGQLARLCFGGSSPAANKRLRKLLDAGYVSALVENLAKENVYTLTRSGLALVDGEGGDLLVRVPRRLDGQLEHLLGINDVRIALALSLPKAGGEIAWWRSDWELRASFREPVVPDAIFRVAWSNCRESIFALELDNRSKAPRGFLRKILGYRAALARGGIYGCPDPVVLAVSRDELAMERYRQGLAHVRLGDRVWFASLKEVREQPGEVIWRTADGSRTLSLRHLATLPYGKEASLGASPHLAGT